MSGDINVDFDAVKQAVQKLNTDFDGLINQVASIGSVRRELQSLGLEAPTSGPEFQRIMERYERDARTLLQTTRNTADALNRAVERHEAQDRAQAQEARTITGNNPSGA